METESSIQRHMTKATMIVTRSICTTRDFLLISLLVSSGQLPSFLYRQKCYNAKIRSWFLSYECSLDDDNKINAILSENTQDYIPQERPWWRFWE